MPEKSEAKDTIFCKKRSLNLRGKLTTIDEPWVMGILNLTPDSFFDGGKWNTTSAAMERAHTILEEGGKIIDIGASSTRPGAEMLSSKEEIARLREPLSAIRKEFPEAILSIDTYQAEVAKAAADLGADIINDISGGTLDPEMARTMGEIKLPYILMHIQGTPQTMQKAPHYENVFNEVCRFLSQQMQEFLEHGVADIILDPGFGFGKNLHHNYKLLNHLTDFQLFERPVLVGVSRKRMINEVLGIQAADALNGTTIINTMALERGADILRVHDVRQAVEAVKIVTFAQKHT